MGLDPPTPIHMRPPEPVPRPPPCGRHKWMAPTADTAVSHWSFSSTIHEVNPVTYNNEV